MQVRTKRNIHVGINFIVAPLPSFDKSNVLRFQSQLEIEKIETTNVTYTPNQISIFRQSPNASLEIRLMNVGPQVSQIIILFSNPDYSMEVIEEEIDRILRVFNNVWPTANKQLISSDSTIRTLYDSTSQHAFQELWENRLNQRTEDLSIFGRPIHGGGIRFVLPPLNQTDPNDPLIEIKIESFLPDPRKIYVEAQFVWKNPVLLTSNITGIEKVQTVDKYINETIVNFIGVN
ncbi:hypothetical protein [Leptospira harrisiae]|uniref:hypothetical protein n=1 Tax=Leptospira harrisiae TaxID=2023189 RepID=UPI000C2A1730|nr:hypothetical protein [Leptospira harrisiae]PKA09993.1 hypothetical protein CH366_10055 [Leptospira harrisiae]